MIEYRDIPGHPGYQAGSDGSIRGKRGWLIRQWMGTTGYFQFTYSHNAKRGWLAVHVAVCEAWHGRRPVGHQVAHEDGNPLNNKASNLSWKTPTQNNADKKRHGTQPGGTKIYWNVKLNDEKVRAIRASDGSLQNLADEYGVSRVAIWRIKNRLAWKHVI